MVSCMLPHLLGAPSSGQGWLAHAAHCVQAYFVLERT